PRPSSRPGPAWTGCSRRSGTPVPPPASPRRRPTAPCSAASATTTSPASARASRPASRSRRPPPRRGTTPPASASSTASARRRCCTSSSRRRPPRRGPVPPASPTPATRRARWTRRATPCRPGPPAEQRPGATGKPIPGYEARVVDEAGNPVPPGTVGRLAVRGPTGCRYLDDDDRQREYVRDGWNYPGDAYLVDDDGYFHYQARTDDLIISGGYNIAGLEVESALLRHPAVAECGVIGVPDELRGQVVKAFVVLRDGHAPGDALVQELQDFVKAEIAPYKYPRAIQFMDALPRTQTGKLQRFRLREMEGEA